MILGLANSLFRLFRENSDVVPVSRLRKQGVRSVTVLDWDRVEQLIERAVEGALSRRGVDLPADALDQVNQEAKEAFQRLVEERDTYRETAKSLEQEKQELNRNLGRLRSELSRSTGDLNRERGRALSLDDVQLDQDGMAQYSKRLENRIRELMDGGPAPRDGSLAERLSILARQLLEEEKEKALTTAREDHTQRVAQMERRIEKLRRTLQDTEGVVERLRKSSKSVEGGIESIYREVQGLNDGDDNAGEKRGVLDQIFQLNVEMREILDVEEN